MEIHSIEAALSKIVITYSDPEEDDIFINLKNLAAHITKLQNLLIYRIDSNKDTHAHDAICAILTSAEKEYFKLFNKYRESRGFEPLEGERFSGEFHNYKSLLFGVSA